MFAGLTGEGDADQRVERLLDAMRVSAGARRSPWRRPRRSVVLLPAVMRAAELFRGLLEAGGVDWPRFRTILELRLRLDLETRPGRGQSAEASAGFGLTLMATFLWLTGLMPGVLALVARDATLWMAAGQALSMFFLAMVLLGPMSLLLIDASDVALLAPLPVSDRTMFAARLAHTLAYTTLLALCGAFFPTFLGCFVFPPWLVLPLYPLCTLLSSFVVVGGFGLLMGVVLRLFGPGRFQRAVLWVQVAGSAALIAGTQIAPRLAPVRKQLPGLLESSWFRFLVPPMHYAGLFSSRSVAGPSATSRWARWRCCCRSPARWCCCGWRRAASWTRCRPRTWARAPRAGVGGPRRSCGSARGWRGVARSSRASASPWRSRGASGPSCAAPTPRWR